MMQMMQRHGERNCKNTNRVEYKQLNQNQHKKSLIN